MNYRRFSSGIFFALTLATVPSLHAAGEKAPKHLMHSDDGRVDIDGIEYKTVEDLKGAVVALPKGSHLQFNTGCIGPRELAVTPTISVEDFKKFCLEHGVKFTISAGLRF